MNLSTDAHAPVLACEGRHPSGSLCPVTDELAALVARKMLVHPDHSAALGAAVSDRRHGGLLGTIAEVTESGAIWVHRTSDDSGDMALYALSEIRLATERELAGYARLMLGTRAIAHDKVSAEYKAARS